MSSFFTNHSSCIITKQSPKSPLNVPIFAMYGDSKSLEERHTKAPLAALCQRLSYQTVLMAKNTLMHALWDNHCVATISISTTSPLFHVSVPSRRQSLNFFSHLLSRPSVLTAVRWQDDINWSRNCCFLFSKQMSVMTFSFALFSHFQGTTANNHISNNYVAFLGEEQNTY